LDSYQIAHTFIFISTLISVFAYIPQIVLNYRLKKGDGVSDGMLLCSFNGFIANNFYVFGCCLPLSYKIMVPIWTFLFLVVLGQRMWYTPTPDTRFKGIVGVNSLVYVGLMPFAFKHSFQTGIIFGWIMLILWSVYQLPQFYKIHKEKSVYGFSFFLVASVFVQALFELTGALILKLPTQTVLNELRNILFFCIFAAQFWRYKWSGTHHQRQGLRI